MASSHASSSLSKQPLLAQAPENTLSHVSHLSGLGLQPNRHVIPSLAPTSPVLPAYSHPSFVFSPLARASMSRREIACWVIYTLTIVSYGVVFACSSLKTDIATSAPTWAPTAAPTTEGRDSYVWALRCLKPLPVLAMATVAYIYMRKTKRSTTQGPYSNLRSKKWHGTWAHFIVAGLLFSALGDLLLTFDTLFLPGLGAFFGTHVCLCVRDDARALARNAARPRSAPRSGDGADVAVACAPCRSASH